MLHILVYRYSHSSVHNCYMEVQVFITLSVGDRFVMDGHEAGRDLQAATGTASGALFEGYSIRSAIVISGQ